MTSRTSRNWKKAWLIGVAGSFGAILLALALWPRSAPHGNATRSPGTATAASAGSATPDHAPTKAVGDRLTYDVMVDSEVRSRGGQSVFGFTLTGRLALTVVEVKKDETLLGIAIRDPKLLSKNDSGQASQKLAGVASALEVPLLFAVDSRGAVTKALASPRTPSLPVNILKSIAASMQLVRPKDDSGATWTVEETDTTGRYLASYERTRRAVFKKQKVRYLELLGVDPSVRARSKAEILESLSGFALDRADDITSLESVERVQGTSGELVQFLEGATRLTLRLTSKSKDVGAALAMREEGQSWQARALYEVPALDGPSPDVDVARIAGRSFENMTTELMSLEGDSEQATDGRQRLFSGMAALFRSSSRAVDEAVRFIKKDSKAARFIMDALATAGTPESQRALASLLDSDLFGSRTRRSGLIGLSMVEHPTEASVAKLVTLFDDPALGRQAVYGYGTAIHNLLDEQPERAQHYLDTLLDRLRKADSPDDQIDVLRALGNAGHPGALTALEGYLTNDNPALRAAAAGSLRFMPGVDAELAGLVRDPDEAVRQEAIQSVAERSPTPLGIKALASVAMHDIDYRTRLLSVRSLAQWASSAPAAHDALAWVAQNEKVDTLRQFAAQHLAG